MERVVVVFVNAADEGSLARKLHTYAVLVG